MPIEHCQLHLYILVQHPLNQLSMHGRKKSHKKHFNEFNFNSNNNAPSSNTNNTNATNNDDLLQKVQRLETDNLKCCDCQSTESVEWISINLLCVLCIRCSGVHRSLGSHISKIRSLTLDNFNDNLELFHLIRHYTSNKFVNEIYEYKLGATKKLAPNCNDLQRLTFISQKYKNKLFVKTPLLNQNIATDYYRNKLIKAIESNNLWKLRYILSRLTEPSLRQLSIVYKDNTNILPHNSTLFQYSLQFSTVKQSHHKLYIISEFLLWNDMIIDKMKDQCPIDPEMDSDLQTYWNCKIRTFGTFDSSPQFNKPTASSSSASASSSSSPLVNTLSQTTSNTTRNNNSNNTLPSRSKSKKRWSLSYIPRSSTQHILNFNHALKTIKDNTTTTTKK